MALGDSLDGSKARSMALRMAGLRPGWAAVIDAGTTVKATQ